MFTRGSRVNGLGGLLVLWASIAILTQPQRATALRSGAYQAYGYLQHDPLVVKPPWYVGVDSFGVWHAAVFSWCAPPQATIGPWPPGAYLAKICTSGVSQDTQPSVYDLFVGFGSPDSSGYPVSTFNVTAVVPYWYRTRPGLASNYWLSPNPSQAGPSKLLRTLSPRQVVLPPNAYATTYGYRDAGCVEELINVFPAGQGLNVASDTCISVTVAHRYQNGSSLDYSQHSLYLSA